MKKQKIGCVLAWLLILGALLTGCANNATVEPREITSEAGSDVLLHIVEDGKTEYSIICAQNVGSELQGAIAEWKKAVKERTGVSLKLLNDYQTPSDDAKEIIIGATTRKESTDQMARLKCNDYVIAIEKHALVIVGGSDDATIMALQHLSETSLSDSGSKSYSIREQDLTEYLAEYPITSLSINETGIGNFRIVYPDGSIYLKNAAENLHTMLAEKTGMDLSTVSDKTAETAGIKEILVGNTNRKTVSVSQADTVAFLYDETLGLQMIGDTVYHTLCAVDLFMSNYLSSVGNVDLLFPERTEYSLPAEQAYQVMSFNMLYSDVEKRVDIVKEMILTELPDSFGLQECTEEWLAKIVPAVSEKYNCVIGEINSPNQFYHPIFYRKDKFDVSESNTLWLSNTPKIQSKFVNSDQHRVVTYAVLKDRTTGEIFTHYNTHLDINKDAAEKQLKVLQDITAKSSTPYVVTGDFNIDMSWPQYLSMQKTWFDSRAVASETTDALTCSNERIDYCMISDGIIAQKFAVINSPYVLKKQWEQGETNGQQYYLSDHYPVTVTFWIH